MKYVEDDQGISPRIEAHIATLAYKKTSLKKTQTAEASIISDMNGRDGSI